MLEVPEGGLLDRRVLNYLPAIETDKKTYITGVGSLIKSDSLQQLPLNMIVYSEKLSLRLFSEEALSQCSIEDSILRQKTGKNWV